MLIISWRGATYPDNVCALFQGKLYEILNAPSFLLKAFLPHLCHHLEHKTLHSKTGKNSNVVLMIYKHTKKDSPFIVFKGLRNLPYIGCPCNSWRRLGTLQK